MTNSKFQLGKVLIAVALLGAAPVGLSACKKPAAKGAAAQPPRAVKVARLEPRPMTGGLTASGTLISREDSAVGSELNGYRVARVFVDVQAWVRAGQPLVQLDDTLLRSQIAQLQATVAQQQAQAAQAEDQAKRVADLDNQGVISQEAISQRRFQAQSARAAVAAAQAAVNDLRTRQTRMIIRAPVTGLVMERNVRPGDISSSAAVMFRIIRDGLVELQADVPEADLSHIRQGDQAQVILPDNASVFGRVRLVSPAVDPATKLGKVRIALPVRSDLRPGGYAKAVFTGASHAVPAVPEGAVSYGAEGPTVMVVDATNHAHRVGVRTGQHGGGLVELVQGPPQGSRVLLSASAFVLDGDLVRPVEASS